MKREITELRTELDALKRHVDEVSTAAIQRDRALEKRLIDQEVLEGRAAAPGRAAWSLIRKGMKRWEVYRFLGEPRRIHDPHLVSDIYWIYSDADTLDEARLAAHVKFDETSDRVTDFRDPRGNRSDD